jgi:hypothetical protein
MTTTTAGAGPDTAIRTARPPLRQRIAKSRRRWAIFLFCLLWPEGIPILCRGIESGTLCPDQAREDLVRRLHRTYYPRAMRSGRSIAELESDIALAIALQGLEHAE